MKISRPVAVNIFLSIVFVAVSLVMANAKKTVFVPVGTTAGKNAAVGAGVGAAAGTAVGGGTVWAIGGAAGIAAAGTAIAIPVAVIILGGTALGGGIGALVGALTAKPKMEAQIVPTYPDWMWILILGVGIFFAFRTIHVARRAKSIADPIT